MSQPSDKICRTPGIVCDFVNMISEGLVKAYTPCQEYCMEKCQKVWRQNKLSEPCDARSATMRSCIQECRNFQYRSPASRD